MDIIPQIHSMRLLHVSRLFLRHGFTIAELLVVVTILAILSTIGFISFQNYTSHTRDTKRMTNVALISSNFDLSIAKNGFVNTSKTSTGYNISIAGSGFTMTGYYGVVNDTLLQSLQIIGSDIAVYDGFQEYRYSYFPNEKKYQALAMMENAENEKSAFQIPIFVDQAIASDLEMGYPFIKWNFVGTGWVSNILIDGIYWNQKTAVNNIKSFTWGEVISPGWSVVASAENVATDGVCGTANGGSSTIAPITGLCAVGTPTTITDEWVNNSYTWWCSGVNGWDATAVNACSATHLPISCIFGSSNFDQCTFAP